MNKRFIIINFAAFAVMLFLSTGCKQDGKQDAVPSYRVITVSSMPVEISESYSATIRGRQDVDIMPNGTEQYRCVRYDNLVQFPMGRNRQRASRRTPQHESRIHSRKSTM